MEGSLRVCHCVRLIIKGHRSTVPLIYYVWRQAATCGYTRELRTAVYVWACVLFFCFLGGLGGLGGRLGWGVKLPRGNHTLQVQTGPKRRFRGTKSTTRGA